MTTTILPAPVRRAVTVRASQPHAFAVFTAGLGRWWPATHSIGKSPQKAVVMEPRAGGRWYETGQDGSQCDWGRVLVWEPPARVVLAWQIGADWRFDPDLVTEVEVRFLVQDAGTTRVELEHRNLERFGDKAETVRASIDGEGGWPGILQRFAEVAAEPRTGAA